MLQAIQKLASDLAKEINENINEEGNTIVCTRRELRYMVEDAIGTRGRDTYERLMEARCMSDLFDEMCYEHNLFLSVSQFDDLVFCKRFNLCLEDI